ncbi:MAG: efflux RND transporter permease subunit [Planctomycetaceae bacterium]
MFSSQGSRFGLLVRRPWMAIFLFAVMTTLSGIGHWRPTLPREVFVRLFPGNAAEAVSPGDANSLQPTSRRAGDRQVASMRLFASEVMLVVTAEDFFRPVTAKAIREVVEDLERLPQVSHVTWMDNAPPLNLFGLPEPALPDHRASLERFDQAKEKALRNPMIAGQLLSRDAKTLLLLLDIDWFHVRSDADCTTHLIAQAQQTLQRHPNARIDVAVTGDMPMRLRIGDKNAENDRKFQWIVYCGVLAMAAILFRGLSAVIIAALPVAVGLFWAFGFIRFLDMDDNPFNFVVVPVLLSMVGFTDSVHIIAQIRARRAGGLPGIQATAAAMDEVGGACFLTSLTTAIGLASLWWAHHTVVQEFGLCCVIGATVMFIAVMTTIPIACRTRLGRGIERGEIGGWIERNFYRAMPVERAIIRRPVPIAIVAVAVTLGTGWLTLQLEPDERAFNGIPEASLEAKALRHMDRAFGGLETSHVAAVWNPTEEVTNEEIIAVSHEIESLLKAERMLASPLGLATLVAALPGEGSPIEKASLVDLLPPPLKQAFWNPELRRTIVVFRLQDLGIASFGETFERVTRSLDAIAARHPGVTLQLEGPAVFRWRNLYRIIVDLAKSLGTASLVIFAVLAVFYRSLRLGLIAIIPNLFPLTITGAAMWALGQPLELVGVLAFTVCLGIAVDDTIHFLSRYRDEVARQPDHKTAIEHAAIGVGAAMVMTTIVLLAGFCTVFMSDSRDHHIFALMGGSTIASAIVGDLIFLPALLVLFGPAQKNTAFQARSLNSGVEDSPGLEG